jgi:hypothetical protein
VITSDWKVKSDGNVLDTEVKVDAEKHNIAIKGSGKNFEGFYNWERSRFEAGKNVGKQKGGLLGMAMNAIAKKATKTSALFVDITDNFTFIFTNDDRRLFLCRKGAIYKQNTTECNERLKLRKIN